jgi:hypothetical protein
MEFHELSEQAQRHAWLLQCWSLKDQPENIVPFSEYGMLADFNSFKFNADGEVITE